MTTPHSLAQVMTDVAQANGLPNAHYTDATLFEEERHAVLYNSWAGVGFGKDVPEPGDAWPVSFLGMPLLIVRDRDGELRVFQNTCRHRGMILVSEPRNITGAIRCPYHSWCYALNGKLHATPHVGGPGQNSHADVRREDLGLIPIRSYVWRDIVFVNIDGRAPEFEVVNGDLMARWAAFDQPVFHGGATSSFHLDIKANWKLAVENYCESYHLPWVHPGLNSYSRLEDHRQLTGDAGEVMSDFAGLGPEWAAGGEYIAIYPNVLLGVQRDHGFAIVLEPEGPEQTRERVEIYYAAPSAATPHLDGLREKNAALWKGVFEEDIFVVEGMQRGRHGVLFDGGRFSPVMDGPTHTFHAWVASKLSTSRQHP